MYHRIGHKVTYLTVTAEFYGDIRKTMPRPEGSSERDLRIEFLVLICVLGVVSVYEFYFLRNLSKKNENGIFFTLDQCIKQHNPSYNFIKTYTIRKCPI
jgi:hypothetical protein